MSDLERLLLDHAEQMMLLVEPTGLRIVAANRVAAQTLGYAGDDLLAKTITDVECALQDIFYWEEVRNGQCQDIAAQEGMYLCADGSTLTVGKSIRVVAHGDKRLFLVQARDVKNERKIADDLAQILSQLRATLESTGNGILVIDGQGRIANMNRLFSSMWKIQDSLLLGHDDVAILDFVAASVVDSETCRQRLREIVDGNETKDIFELRDGRVFECRSRPQYLGERIIGRVFGYDDITERRQAELALRESRNRLEEKVLERTSDLRAANTALLAERARQEELIKKLAEAHAQLLQSEKMASIGQLAAGVAHEINNPVGFVNSNLGALQRYVEDLLRLLSAYEGSEAEMNEATRAVLTELKQQVDIGYLRDDIGNLLAESTEGLQRVKRIVQDLKNFSHVAGTEKQWANLEQGLDSTLNVVWNELKYKADVVKEYGGVSEVQCILSQLNQVFMNLLVNAAHAIEDHGRITIRTGELGEDVWVEVEDTGKGILPEHLDRIFDPFFTTKPVGTGTGLGLSLSYSIVQQHGGRIEVKSESGKGSIFKVILPRFANPANAPATPQE
ncbi:MAG: histidine kinase [Rhodocyclales bacterium RIFCSPLOWO2_02_FULL_63_24]|nr:MAG: histidine kinase [Rhodocyclales bacterium RIFCSPLOWO2_02_FULL_63_24]